MFSPVAMFSLSELEVFRSGIRLEGGSSLELRRVRVFFLGSAEVICFRIKEERVSLSMEKNGRQV